MSNLGKRITTSIIYVALILIALYFGEISSLILLAIFLLLSLIEFYGLFKTTSIKPQQFVPILIGLLAFIGIASDYLKAYHEIIIIGIFSLLFIIELFRLEKKPIQNLGIAILGIMYIAVPLAYVYKIGFVSADSSVIAFNPKLILAFFIIVWTNDTAAYFVGSAIGKHKLFPKISPKKSWEGFFGGVFFGILVGYINYLVIGELSMLQWLIAAFVAVIFATLGDLVESSFKRSLDIKDSGTLLPGHGGILDRLDGIFLSAPMFYLALSI